MEEATGLGLGWGEGTELAAQDTLLHCPEQVQQGGEGEALRLPEGKPLMDATHSHSYQVAKRCHHYPAWEATTTLKTEAHSLSNIPHKDEIPFGKDG